MNAVRFVLRNKDKNTYQSVYIAYNFSKNDKLLITTKIKVKAKFWDLKKQKVNSTSEKNIHRINTQLSKLKLKIEEYIIKTEQSGQTLTKPQLKNFIELGA